MSLKTSFAAVLKAMRLARGLSQKKLAEVSSRTYVSKLERGQSSPTLEMITALSAPLGVSPLTFIAMTLGAETGQSLSALVSRVEIELEELSKAGVLRELDIPTAAPAPLKRVSGKSAAHRPSAREQQTEFHFAD